MKNINLVVVSTLIGLMAGCSGDGNMSVNFVSNPTGALCHVDTHSTRIGGWNLIDGQTYDEKIEWTKVTPFVIGNMDTRFPVTVTCSKKGYKTKSFEVSPGGSGDIMRDATSPHFPSVVNIVLEKN